MKNIVALIVCILLFIACNNPERSSEIARIDSLYKVLDTLSLKLKQIDTAGIKARNKEYGYNINKIKENFHDNPKDTAWTIMAQYGGIKKTFKKYLTNYILWKREIDFSKSQLDSLKKDVKNNLMTKENFKKYFKEEAEAVSMLNQEIIFNTQYIDNYTKLFDTLNPKIEKIVEQLKKKGVNIN